MARPRWSTESGLPQTYLLLRARWDAQGREWVKVRIPVRPNGRTGWVKRDALGAFHLTHLLVVVDRQRLQILLYRSGRLVWSAPVAVGKPSTPTPPGRFWITERFKIENPSSGYWPYAFGTSDYSTLTDWPEGGVVGLHGPYYQPQLIPGRISHGCIRLRVADDAWLASHVFVERALAVGEQPRVVDQCFRASADLAHGVPGTGARSPCLRTLSGSAMSGVACARAEPPKAVVTQWLARPARSIGR